ncbi:7190_t:CDS:1, partial [Ambispora gerdemannii]
RNSCSKQTIETLERNENELAQGSGRFGYLDIFVLEGTGGNDINLELELKYTSFVGLVRDTTGNQIKIGANEL